MWGWLGVVGVGCKSLPIQKKGPPILPHLSEPSSLDKLLVTPWRSPALLSPSLTPPHGRAKGEGRQRRGGSEAATAPQTRACTDTELRSRRKVCDMSQPLASHTMALPSHSSSPSRDPTPHERAQRGKRGASARGREQQQRSHKRARARTNERTHNTQKRHATPHPHPPVMARPAMVGIFRDALEEEGKAPFRPSLVCLCRRCRVVRGCLLATGGHA